MYLEFWPDVWYETHVDAPIMNPKEFVYHGLIRPLRQEGRDGVIASVEDEEQWWNLRSPELE